MPPVKVQRGKCLESQFCNQCRFNKICVSDFPILGAPGSPTGVELGISRSLGCHMWAPSRDSPGSIIMNNTGLLTHI